MQSQAPFIDENFGGFEYQDDFDSFFTLAGQAPDMTGDLQLSSFRQEYTNAPLLEQTGFEPFENFASTSSAFAHASYSAGPLAPEYGSSFDSTSLVGAQFEPAAAGGHHALPPHHFEQELQLPGPDLDAPVSNPEEIVWQSIEDRPASNNVNYFGDSTIPTQGDSSADTSFASDNFDTSATSVDDDDDDGDDIVLQYNSIEEAMAMIDNRRKLNLPNDDWQQMEADPFPYVRRVVKAFNSDATDSPGDSKFNENEQQCWNDFQDDHIGKVAKHKKSIELAAWSVVNACILTHKLGVKNFKQPDWRARCSLRLQEVIDAIADIAIIRYDLVRFQRLDELINDPVSCIARKMANFAGNLQKAKRDKENQARAEEHGVEYVAVLGSKREPAAAGTKKKRKRDELATNLGEPETEESEPQAKKQKRPVRRASSKRSKASC